MSNQPREPVCKFCGDKDCWYGACRKPAPSAEPPATDDLDKAREELSDVTHFDDVVALVAKLRATVERQAREIADLSARLAGLEQYRARDKLAQRVLTAEAECDALRECIQAADYMRENYTWPAARIAYDAVRAKVGKP